MGLSSSQLAEQLIEKIRNEVRAEVTEELTRVLARTPKDSVASGNTLTMSPPQQEAKKVDGRKKPRTAAQIRAAKKNIEKARAARAAKTAAKISRKKKRKTA